MAALALLSPSVVALLDRGMTSMAATVAFGLVLDADVPPADAPRLLWLPLVAPWSCMLDVPCEPDVSYPLELPAAPELPEEPDEPEEPLAPPQLPPPCAPVPPPVPDMPPLVDVPVAVPLLPVSPAVPLLPLLPMPPPRQELHADSPTASASKPARKTLWCFCFMINSF
jgi:hypothetical protein